MPSRAPLLFLAVDCGGTKAAAAICDQHGTLLGRGLGGPANYTDVGEHLFVQHVGDAVQAALANAGISRSAPQFQAAWLGIAGVDSPLDVLNASQRLAHLLTLPFPSPRLVVANDTSLLASPVHDPSMPNVRTGVVVIAGTGSIVVSFRRGSGKHGSLLRTLGRVGGFGWLLGDEGSGWAVGRDALRAVLNQADQEKLLARVESDEDEDGEESDYSDGSADDERQGDSSEAKGQPYCNGHLSSPATSHMLRDRILEQWGLVSTDDLLAAVYSSQIPSPAPPSDAAGQSSSSPTSPISASAFSRALLTHDKTGSAALLPPPAPLAGDPEHPRPPSSPVPPLSRTRTPEPNRRAAVDSIEEEPADAKEAVSPPLSAHNGLSPSTSSSALPITPPPPASAPLGSATAAADPVGERKHRLAALAPLVFHLAFHHADAPCLRILERQARRIAAQVRMLVRPAASGAEHAESPTDDEGDEGDDEEASARPPRRPPRARRRKRSQHHADRTIEPAQTVLCLGGSLLSIQAYRDLVVGALERQGVRFAAVRFVDDPSAAGARALAGVWREGAAEENGT